MYDVAHASRSGIMVACTLPLMTMTCAFATDVTETEQGQDVVKTDFMEYTMRGNGIEYAHDAQMGNPPSNTFTGGDDSADA